MVMFTGSVGDRQEGDGAGGRDADPGEPRARRQGPDDRARRRGSRAGRQRRGQLRAEQLGPGVHLGRADLRRGAGPRRVPRAADRARSRALRQGPPGEPGSVDVGAIIFPPQIELIEAHVRDAVDKGARGRHRRQARRRAAGRFYEPTVLADVDHSMRCMVEETFGPTLPVMRVADAEQAVAARQRRAATGCRPRSGPATPSGARRWRAGSRPGCAASTTRRSTTWRSSCRWAAGRPRGWARATAPDGIRKYTKRQSLLITPGYAPSRELHMFPYSAEVTDAGRRDDERARGERDLQRRAAARRCAVLCDTSSRRSSRPHGEGDPTGFWARAASHLGVPEAIEIALLQSGAPGGADRGPARRCSTRSPSRAWSPRLRRRSARQIVHGVQRLGARGARRASRRCAGCTDRCLLRAARPRRPGATRTGTRMGYPGPQALPSRPTCRSRSGPSAPASEERDVEADVCVVGSGAGGGVVAGELAARRQAGLRARDGRLLQRGRLRPARALGLPEPLPERGAVPDRRGAGLDPGRLGARRRHGHQLDQLPAHPPTGCASEWAASTGSRASTAPTTTRHLDAVWSASAPTTSCSDLNGPHQRLQEGCEALGYDFRLDHPQRRPARPTTRTPPATWASATSRARSTRPQKTYLADAADRRRRPRRPTAGSSGSSSRTAGPPGSRRAMDRSRAAANGARSRVSARRRSSSPAARSSRRRCCCAPGSAARRSATTCGCTRRARSPASTPRTQDAGGGPPQAALSHQFADLEDGYGFLIECAQHTTGLIAAALALALGPRPQGARCSHWRRGAAFINLTRDRGHGRVDDRRRRQRRSLELRAHRRARHRATSAAASRS